MGNMCWKNRCTIQFNSGTQCDLYTHMKCVVTQPYRGRDGTSKDRLSLQRKPQTSLPSARIVAYNQHHDTSRGEILKRAGEVTVSP
jgi:hypothetical protein